MSPGEMIGLFIVGTLIFGIVLLYLLDDRVRERTGHQFIGKFQIAAMCLGSGLIVLAQYTYQYSDPKNLIGTIGSGLAGLSIFLLLAVSNIKTVGWRLGLLGTVLQIYVAVFLLACLTLWLLILVLGFFAELFGEAAAHDDQQDRQRNAQILLEEKKSIQQTGHK